MKKNGKDDKCILKILNESLCIVLNYYQFITKSLTYIKSRGTNTGVTIA